MKSPCSLLVGLMALAAASGRADDLVDLLVGKRELDVITTTDVTEAGQKLTPATPQAPVYYVAATSGFKNLGGISAGEGNMADSEAIRVVAKVLAGRGYLPATASSPPPELLLVFIWGTLNVNEIDLPDADGEEGLMKVGQLNRAQMLRFLGARNIGDLAGSQGAEAFAGLGMSSEEMSRFDELASKDLYVATVSAYDLKAASREKKQLLWMTRIACPASGFSLQKVLPTMLAIAAPNIGRETARPVWVNVGDKYKAEVKIHDLKLLEYLEKGPLPVIQSPKAEQKPRQRRRPRVAGHWSNHKTFVRQATRQVACSAGQLNKFVPRSRQSLISKTCPS